MTLSKRLRAEIAKVVIPIFHSLKIKSRTMGSYGNVMICEIERNRWYLRADAPIDNTLTLVIFRNGARMTRNLDYTVDPHNYRCIIGGHNWKVNDTVIADAGL